VVWGRLLVGGLSVVAWSIEESISPPLPAGIAKALLFLDCGMVWNSARLLHGRQIVWAGMIFGARCGWSPARFPDFAHWTTGRVILGSMIVAAYTHALAA
jgi:hypothetical protein